MFGNFSCVCACKCQINFDIGNMSDISVVVDGL